MKVSNHDLAECDGVGYSNMKDMEKVLGDFTKQTAQRHVFCSALQCALWYKAIDVDKEGERDSTKEDSNEDEFKRDVSKGLELRPAFEIGNYAVHYIRAAGLYQ